jgi:uncharacterized protein (DUF488 family)
LTPLIAAQSECLAIGNALIEAKKLDYVRSSLILWTTDDNFFMENTVFTIGHSNRSFDEFVKLLTDHNVSILIDVRSKPYSRYVPHFNRETMAHKLPLTYFWRGDTLGGFDDDIDPTLFESSIDELVELSKSETVCVMCTEKEAEPTKRLPSGCHRWFKITPALEKRGITVVHI